MLSSSLRWAASDLTGTDFWNFMSFAAGRAAGLAESPQQGSEWHGGSRPRGQSDRGGQSSSSWDDVGILGNRKATCSATGHVPEGRRTPVITLSPTPQTRAAARLEKMHGNLDRCAIKNRLYTSDT